MMAAFIVNANIESLALVFADALCCYVKKRNVAPIERHGCFFSEMMRYLQTVTSFVLEVKNDGNKLNDGEYRTSGQTSFDHPCQDFD